MFFKSGDWLDEGAKSSIKGHCFEKSVINSIKNNKIVFEKRYDVTIKLNEICSMDFEVKDKLSEALLKIQSNDKTKNINEKEVTGSIEGLNKNITIHNNKNNKNINQNIKKDINVKDSQINIKNESNKPSEIIKRRFETVKKIIDDNYKNISRDLPKYLSEKTYKDNLLDIKDFKKNINLFEKMDNRERKKVSNYNNNSILIEQDKINGRCIDLAMIWKNIENKNIFIGFQIKCFREETIGGNASKLSKMLIKCNYLDILMNSEDLFGIQIDEWHYIMILFCNQKKETNGVCKYLVNKCINNGIKYMFYDPIQEIFYDKNLKEIDDVYTLLDINSNLDFGINYSEIENNLNKISGTSFLGKKHKLSSAELLEAKKNDIKSFKDFLSECSLSKKYSFLKFKKDLMNIFNDIQNIKFVAKMSTIDLEVLTPSLGSIFCYKGKNNTILVIIKRDENKGIEYCNLFKKTNYKIFWDFSIDLLDANYFYLLNFEKKNN